MGIFFAYVGNSHSITQEWRPLVNEYIYQAHIDRSTSIVNFEQFDIKKYFVNKMIKLINLRNYVKVPALSAISRKISKLAEKYLF